MYVCNGFIPEQPDLLGGLFALSLAVQDVAEQGDHPLVGRGHRRDLHQLPRGGLDMQARDTNTTITTTITGTTTTIIATAASIANICMFACMHVCMYDYICYNCMYVCVCMTICYDCLYVCMYGTVYMC